MSKADRDLDSDPGPKLFSITIGIGITIAIANRFSQRLQMPTGDSDADRNMRFAAFYLLIRHCRDFVQYKSNSI